MSIFSINLHQGGRNTWLTIALLVLLCFLISAQNNECSFNFSFNVNTITCSNQNLNGRITKNALPAGIVYLIIQNCTGNINGEAFKNLGELYSISIDASTLNTFTLPALPKLSDLDIRNSMVPKLSQNYLKNVKNLKHITFENNKMELENGCFQDLNNLLTLDIERQNVTLNGNFLTGLKKLSLLNLVETGISRIPSEIFKETTELVELKLDKNPIQFIGNDVLDPLKKLKHFSILETNLEKLDLHLFKQSIKLESLGAPARSLMNLDLQKLLNFCPNLFNFYFKLEDCGRPEVDNLVNQAVKLKTVIKIYFDGFLRQNNNC